MKTLNGILEEYKTTVAAAFDKMQEELVLLTETSVDVEVPVKVRAIKPIFLKTALEIKLADNNRKIANEGKKLKDKYLQQEFIPDTIAEYAVRGIKLRVGQIRDITGRNFDPSLYIQEVE